MSNFGKTSFKSISFSSFIALNLRKNLCIDKKYSVYYFSKIFKISWIFLWSN